MCVFDWALALEYLKVVLSWQVVVLALAIFVVLKFRDALDGLISRVIRGSILGNSFEAAPAQTQFKPAEFQPDTSSSTNSPVVGDAAIPDFLSNDAGFLSAVDLARTAPIKTVLYFRQTVFWLNYERIFTRIFGTQIAALAELENATGPMPIAKLEKFYNEHQALRGGTNYPIEAYFGFLEAFALIEQKDGVGGKAVSLTQNGREFLEYIRTQYATDWNKRPN